MKKMPLRTCVVCHSKIEKRDLVRIVCNKENELFYDKTGKANGRGAYICRDPKCIETFLTKNVLERAFKRQIDRETVEEVRKNIKEQLL
ncbi:MAG: YlxR family protein [Eubacterium sp.]